MSESGAGLVQLSSLEVTSGTYTMPEPTSVSGACVRAVGQRCAGGGGAAALSAGCVQVGGVLMVQPGAGGLVLSSGGVFVLGGGSWSVNGSGTAQIAISGGLAINGSASIAGSVALRISVTMSEVICRRRRHHHQSRPTSDMAATKSTCHHQNHTNRRLRQRVDCESTQLNQQTDRQRENDNQCLGCIHMPDEPYLALSPPCSFLRLSWFSC